MEVKAAKKISYLVNSVLLSIVFVFLGFFIKLNVPFLIWFSIPSIIVYLINYVLIYKAKLDIYVWTSYAWLLLYTSVTAVCLGESYGFHLYCFSMIPCVYTIEYMSFRLGSRSVKSFNISVCISLFYLMFMTYLSRFGPVYDTGKRFSTFFLIFNSATVFGYIVLYTNYLIRNIISSETRLTEMAHFDRLTGLHNRHYMLEKLSALPQNNMAVVLAIADIDDFKIINDTYGHNAGDEVLRVVSNKMKEICTDCDISRWGGEEFLILCPADENKALQMLETVRSDIENNPVEYAGNRIKVTVTVGMSQRKSDDSTDEWIHRIDQMLYTGKNSGKNKVVHE